MQVLYYRKKLGIKQKDLAKLLGVTPTCVCDWEKGYREPNISMLLKLSEILKCSVDDLLGRKVENVEELKKFSTEELVNELAQREGVYKTIAEPCKDVKTINGSAIIITIIG